MVVNCVILAASCAVVGNKMQPGPFNLEKNVSCYDNASPVLFSGPSMSDVTKITGKLCEGTSKENRSVCRL